MHDILTKTSSEDFGRENAKRILDKYKPQIACFNDDIQGTGIVALAAIFAGLHVSHVRLQDARVVIFGCGSAGVGVADRIVASVAVETQQSMAETSKQVWYVSQSSLLGAWALEKNFCSYKSYRCLDKQGLLLKSQADQLTAGQAPLAREDHEWPAGAGTDLLSVIKTVKPHVLVGVSTRPGAFTEEIIREMAKHVESPIIMPLSNPSRLHEAQPKDINDWTDGRALIATGSPFPPVDRHGKKYEIGELYTTI